MQQFRAIFGNVNSILAIILLVVIIFIISNWTNDLHTGSYDEKLDNMEDIFIMRRLQSNNNNIFFIETSCVFKKNIPPSGLQLNSRQLCAVYSTAKLNPTRQIILYHSCPLHKDFYERSAENGKYLLKLPNVYVFHTKIEKLLKGSFVERVMNGKLQHSHYLVEHASDVLRLLLVYRYGGAYLDLDFISRKSLDSLAHNFIVAESNSLVSNGIFHFEYQGQGNQFLKEMLMDLAYNYNGESWAGNGPYLVTRHFKKFCNISESASVMTEPKKACPIIVYKPKLFFPIYYQSWKSFFLPKEADTVKEKLNDTYVVHFWNFLSKNEPVVIGENSAYEILANEYCKEIIMSSGGEF